MFWKNKGDKFYLFELVYWKIKYEHLNFKGNIVIFAKKLVVGELLIVVSKVREVSVISKITREVAIFVKNIRYVSEI